MDTWGEEVTVFRHVSTGEWRSNGHDHDPVDSFESMPTAAALAKPSQVTTQKQNQPKSQKVG